MFGVDQILIQGRPNTLNVFNGNIANKGILSLVDNFQTNSILGPVLWDGTIQAILPGVGTGLTVIGNTVTSTGVITHIISPVSGNQINWATWTGILASGGASFGAANLYLGNASGYNGFFMVSQFTFPDATGTFTTGIRSGFRFFCGATDVALGAQLLNNDVVSNKAGFSLYRSTGTTNRNDVNFQFSTMNNSAESIYDTSIPFNTGLFRGIIYLPAYPNTGNIYWQLNDLSRGTQSTGITTGERLPTVNTAMRAMLGIVNLSGTAGISRSIRSSAIYTEV